MNFDEFAKNAFQPAMKAQGFAGRSTAFRRKTAGFEQVVQVQFGQRGLSDQFCINLYAHPLLEGYPGLPAPPLKIGEHWISPRLAPSGVEDMWWSRRNLMRGDVDQIITLSTSNAEAWFSALQSLEGFAAEWDTHCTNLEHVAAHFGTTEARFVYLHAVIGDFLGNSTTATYLAEEALRQTPPRATGLRAHIEDFKSTVTSRMDPQQP